MLISRAGAVQISLQPNYMPTAVKIIGEKSGNFVFERSYTHGLSRVDLGDFTVLAQKLALYY